MNKIIPKLSFYTIKDTELDDYAKDKVIRINTVPAFAAVNPSTAQVENKIIEYVKAAVKADDGAKADTALKKQKRIGELKASWDTMADARNFTVQVFTNSNNPDGSVIKEYIKPKIGRSKTLLNDLPSGKDVFVRVRANGGSSVFGAWSDVAEKRVP